MVRKVLHTEKMHPFHVQKVQLLGNIEYPLFSQVGFVIEGVINMQKCTYGDHPKISTALSVDCIRWQTSFLASMLPRPQSFGFIFWQHLKSVVYKTFVDTLENPRAWIIIASADIASILGMFQHVWQYFKHQCQFCNDLHKIKTILIKMPHHLFSDIEL